MTDVAFRVLGPVEVIHGDAGVVPLGRGTLTDLLVTLIVSPDQVVPTETIIETVWHARRPAHPRAALHSAVARLRRLTGEDFIQTVPSGYRFSAEADRVDLLRFERLREAARRPQQTAAALATLTEAIELWRGAPLENVVSPVLLTNLVPRLTELYLQACEEWAELGLQAGRHDAVVSRLAAVVDAHPFRERMIGQLIVALYRDGRQAEALASYDAVRRALNSEMGIDPSPALQELHLKMLRVDPSLLTDTWQLPSPALPLPAETGDVDPPSRDAPTAVTAVAGRRPEGGPPHRLPADTRAFTGRHAELAQLLELAGDGDDGHGPGTVPIWAIDGMAGIGKTALAVHAAHGLADRFGDGQLFIDLHGYSQGYPPRTAGQALETFLRALNVPPQQIPEDVEERAVLYRERLAGTRTLVVLDNAADEVQVRPLIPGGGGCLVLVTSRRKLKGLDDAHTMALHVLPELDAIALFCSLAGPGRVAAHDPAVAQIVGLCGHLPLAVRIAAALLRNRPAWSPGYLADRLRSAPHTGLDVLFDGDRDLAAVFSLSSETLDADQQRLYRHLCLAPGPEIDAYAAAALLGTDPATAERLLQDLVDHNLLLEPVAGRYRMHDLIRAHSDALAGSDPEAARHAALDRLLDYYLHTACRADARIARYPQPEPIGPPPAYSPVLPDADAARAWLRAERANLTACFEHARQGGDDGRTVGFCAGLASLLRADGPWPQAISLHTAAAAAATRRGDRSGQARALTELGDLRRVTADYPGADRDLEAALVLWREAGDISGEARALSELGALRIRALLSDRQGGGKDLLRTALRLWREVGSKSGQVPALIELGRAEYFHGDNLEAERNFRAALELCLETGDRPGQARTLTELARVQRQTGEYEGAIKNSAAALAICEEVGDRLGQANALKGLGTVLRLIGDYAGAARHQQAALDVYTELGDRLGQTNARVLLGEVRGLTGDHEGAARDLEEGIRAYRDNGDTGNEAWALNYYAAAIGATGDLARANALYLDALRLARQVQQPDDEAVALHGLGQNYLSTGSHREGADCLRQALAIYQRLGMPAAGEVAARLAEIETLSNARTHAEARLFSSAHHPSQDQTRRSRLPSLRRANGNANHRLPNRPTTKMVTSTVGTPLATTPVTSRTAAETASPTVASPAIAITFAARTKPSF